MERCNSARQQGEIVRELEVEQCELPFTSFEFLGKYEIQEPMWSPHEEPEDTETTCARIMSATCHVSITLFLKGKPGNRTFTKAVKMPYAFREAYGRTLGVSYGSTFGLEPPTLRPALLSPLRWNPQPG